MAVANWARSATSGVSSGGFLDDLDARVSNSVVRFGGSRQRCLDRCRRTMSAPKALRAVRKEDRSDLLESINLHSFPDQVLCSQQSSEVCPDRKTLDRWVKESIVEIVNNIRDAPFLHFVFDSKPAGSERRRRQVSDQVFSDPDCWSYVKKSAEDASPDGLILVQKLDEQGTESVHRATALPGRRCPAQETSELCLQAGSRAFGDEGQTDVWGVLVQGKSVMASSCYILQTTRIAVAGAGGTCTRFCLTRAQCFGPSLKAQLERMWLVL